MAEVDEASHGRVTNVWRPPGMGACYRAACSCGWISSTPEVGYGYPISHDPDGATGTLVGPWVEVEG